MFSHLETARETLLNILKNGKCPKDGTAGRILTSYICLIEESSYEPLTRVMKVISTLLNDEDIPILETLFKHIDQCSSLPWCNPKRSAIEIACAAFLFCLEGNIPKEDMANGFIALAAQYYDLGASDDPVIRNPYHGVAGISAPIRSLFGFRRLREVDNLVSLDQIRWRKIWDLVVILDPRIRGWSMKTKSRLEANLIDAPLLATFGISYERYIREITFLEEECGRSMSQDKIFAIIHNVHKNGWAGIAEEYFANTRNRIIAEFNRKVIENDHPDLHYVMA